MKKFAIIQADSITADTVNSAYPADSLAMENASFGELYEPPPVPFTFDTIGWEVLGLLILLAILFCTGWIIRHYFRNKYRREALQALNGMPEISARNVFVILKNTASRVFGRERAGNLFGREWLMFLDNTAGNVSFQGMEQAVSKELYQGVELTPELKKELMANAVNWIRKHARKS